MLPTSVEAYRQNMKTQYSKPANLTGHSNCIGPFIRNKIVSRQIFAAALALIVWAMLMPVGQAQTAIFRGGHPLRVTVPIGFTGIMVVSNNMSVGTNGLDPFPDGTGTNFVINPVFVTVAGLPAGVTYNITNYTSTNIFVSTTVHTNNGTTPNLLFNFFFDGTTPEGTYPFEEDATGGATNHLLLTLDVAHIWNGLTNAVLNGAGNWSDSSKWQGGALVSGTGADVIFNDQGGQTNNVQTVIGSFTNVLYVNSVVDNDMVIGSLRFSQIKSGTAYHTIQISPGKTLTITGTNGFSILRDFLNGISGITAGQLVTFSATNATLVVSNTSANFSVLPDNLGQHLCTLDLSRVGTFRAIVNRFALGNALAYPNFWNLDANGYGSSEPAKMIPDVLMAKINILTAYFVGPDNYTNDLSRECAINFTKNASGSTTTTQPIWNLGLSNVFNADSICFNGYGSGAAGIYVKFGFTNNPIAIFRGTNGGNTRMSMMTIADGAGTNGAISSTKGGVDFGTQHGRVDALVDRLIIAADRPVIASGSSSTPNFQGFLGMGAGTFDANTVILGYQHSGVHTNDISQNYLGYCQATLNVSNTAVFKANTSLTLGYTTETNNGSTTVGAETANNHGQINVNNGGVVMANTILVGGVTKGSQNNNITLASAISTNISTLIISNTIADTNMMLSTLAMNGYSTLAFNIDGNRTDPYIYTTNFTTTPPNNNFYISSVRNIAGYPALIPLIAYQTGTPTIGIAPDGFVTASLIATNYGSLNGYAVLLTTNAPKHLLWRGGNGTWDFTSLVWLDQGTGLTTNFAAGDFVAFDDASGPNITVSFGVVPGAINMTNSSLNFVFTGSAIAGSGATLNKWGTGSLEFDVPSAVSLVLNQGTVTNTSPSASFGGVTTATNTMMVFSGDIFGGLACAGTATLFASPHGVNGTVIIQSGGILTNWNTINGVPSQQANTLVYNVGTVVYSSGTWNVVANATLINAGNITADAITVNGTFEDTGSGSLSLYSQLQFSNGALFIPGGDGIGATTVYGIGSSSLSGRVTFLTGSTNIFKVNFDSGDNYTILLSSEQDFGPSAGNPNYNGGTLLITNTGITPFTAGKNLWMIRNSDDGGASDLFGVTGTATNSYPIMVPAAPGPNLAWNIQDIVRTGRVKTIGVNTNPVPVVLAGTTKVYGNIFTNSFTTNGAVITAHLATNNVMFVDLNWPADHTGWKLQTQSNPLSVGLATNWATVFGSPWVSSMTLSNLFTTGNAIFYRLVYP